MSHDYFKISDLNPPPGAGGPINQPTDPRALHYFPFMAQGQELALTGTTTAGTFRVLYSFGHDYSQGSTFPPPLPGTPKISGQLVPFGPFGPTGSAVKYDENHDRRHVLVWLDPSGPVPPVGQPIEVSVRAWRTE